MHNCLSVDCEDNEIEVSGSTTMGSGDTWCEDCPDYEKPVNGTICQEPNCPANAIVLKDGTCEDCPEYYGPDNVT
jgi:hypothetical protein